MVILSPASDELSPDVKKNKVLNTHFEKEHRLVEYFVIVSSVPRNKTKVSEDEESKVSLDASPPRGRGWSAADVEVGDADDDEFIDDYDFQPVITARYPLEDHDGNPLHESVTFFCHPSGGIRLRTECSMPKVHYFAATGGHGKQMYGTCLTLWEPYIITATRSSPKKVNMDGTVEESEKSERKKEVYLPKCLVLLSTYPYLVAFREYLTQLNRLSKMGEMTLPLERYIANFCAEIPAPPPGSFEVQTTILDSVIKVWSPPHNQPIAYVALPFSHLFQCLDLDNVITVWQCLAVERQVLLTSTQLSLLTTSAEILLSLLFPMRWSHAYIPVLPHFLIPILSAPMPFLCGINKANLADALYDLSPECVVVDLDKNLVTMGPSTERLPPFPKSLDFALRQKLEENAGMVFREARSLTKNDDFSDRGAHLPPHVKLMADGMWESQLCLFDEAFHLMFTPEESRKNLLNGNDNSGIYSDDSADIAIRIMTAADKQNLRKQSQWDAVQEAFLNTYVGLLRNYRKFLVFPSKDNEGSYGGAGFRSKEFIQAQPYVMQEFLQQLIGTQMFDDFITKRLYGSGEADVTFFDVAVDRFLKDSRIGNLFKSSSDVPGPGPLLQSARVHRKLKTIVPPEPSTNDLPPPPQSEEEGGGAVISTLTDDNLVSDDHSVGSTSTQGTHSTRGTRSTSRSLAADSMSNPGNLKHKAYRSIQDKAEEILEKHRGYRYMYPTFPSTFNADLFGTPRPMPSAVIAEFDRQRQDAAQFRRKKSRQQKQDKKQQLHRVKSATDPDVPPSAEVSTFTLFFMAFSTMVGKELLEISDNPLIAKPERVILSTFVPPSTNNSDDESEKHMPKAPDMTGSETSENDHDDDFEDALDEIEKAAAAQMKSVRPDLADFEDCNQEEDENVTEEHKGKKEESEVGSDLDVEDQRENEAEKLDANGKSHDFEKAGNGIKESATMAGFDAELDTSNNGHAGNSGSEEIDDEEPRRRFRDSLSALQIEEAKATGRAQLGLAFELLTMMKKRGLKADPEAYQCLIEACGRVGDTKRATELLAKMHEDGIVADGVVYSCLVSAFSAESAWKQAIGTQPEDLPAWANGSSIEMDWNKLQKHSFRDNLKKQINALRGKGEDDDDIEEFGDIDGSSTYQKFRSLMSRKMENKQAKPKVSVEPGMEFFVTEAVERQIELGENLLEIVYPDISVDTDNETCPRCNFLLSDDDVVAGWTPGDPNDYMTSCPNCMQRFVPHFCVQSTSSTFMGSRGPASALFCERLSPWVLQKEIRSVMSDREGIENLLSTDWREKEIKNSVLWWNLVLSCMRYRFPFTFLLQGSFEQNLISPMPEDE